jgi:hypothetical protein
VFYTLERKRGRVYIFDKRKITNTSSIKSVLFVVKEKPLDKMVKMMIVHQTKSQA